MAAITSNANHQHRIHVRHDLLPGDFARRLRFSVWFNERCRRENFLAHLLFGDKASFVMNGESTHRMYDSMRQKDSRLHSILKGAILESTLRPRWHFVRHVFTWEIELRIERARRIKISFGVETRFRFMHRQSYFSGYFNIHTLNYVNKTSDFANNLYFGHNERRFHSEFYSRVKFRSKFT